MNLFKGCVVKRWKNPVNTWKTGMRSEIENCFSVAILVVISYLFIQVINFSEILGICFAFYLIVFSYYFDSYFVCYFSFYLSYHFLIVKKNHFLRVVLGWSWVDPRMVLEWSWEVVSGIPRMIFGWSRSGSWVVLEWCWGWFLDILRVVMV